MTCPTMQRTPFTLIELMAVIAIISILASLLLPTINSARDNAYMAVCTSNLRQMSIGSIAYANDHHGKFMATVWDEAGNPNNWTTSASSALNKNLSSWKSPGKRLAPYVSFPDDFNFNLNTTNNKFNPQTAGPMFCPSAQNRGMTGVADMSVMGLPRYDNGLGWYKNNGETYRTLRLRDDAENWLFFDFAFIGDDHNGNRQPGVGYNPHGETKYSMSGAGHNNEPWLRINRKRQVVHLDGHVDRHVGAARQKSSPSAWGFRGYTPIGYFQRYGHTDD